MTSYGTLGPPKRDSSAASRRVTMENGEVAPLRKYNDAAVSSLERNDDAPQPESSRLDEGDFVTKNENEDLKRGLSQRHISLIAIAGAIVGYSNMLPMSLQSMELTFDRGLVSFSALAARSRPVAHWVLCWAMLWLASSSAAFSSPLER